jgi:hypothetical protein
MNLSKGLRVALLSTAALGLAGCAGLAKQVGATKGFADCQFRLKSVREVSLHGVPAAELASLGQLALKLGSAFNEEEFWLRFRLGIEVRNPNPMPASLNKVEWILLLDDVEMVRGVVDEKIQLPPGPISIAELPIGIEVDLKKTFSRQSMLALFNLAVNFSGMGDKPTRLMARIRPTVEIAGMSYEFGNYIDVKHEFTSRVKPAPPAEPTTQPQAEPTQNPAATPATTEI